MNFKMVAIVGFVLLGLILGGFYFLKASPTVPAAIETIPQAATTEIPRGQRRTDVTEPPMSGAPDLKQRDQENWRKP
jgi:hypothetical protein